MPSPLAGRTVLLTGASSGIGWAAAEELARRGCLLTLAARRQDKLMELAGRLGGDVQVLPWDVSDTAKAPGLIETVVKKRGRLDILVNNAGIMATARFHEQPWKAVEDVMRTNYLGAAALIHAALPQMLRDAGHIVNVASIAGLMGLPYMGAYCASKFALVGLTEALRREYRGTGVTFTAVCPGSVDTPMAADSLKDPELSRLARPKTAGQVARLVADCCADRRPEAIYGDAPGALVRLSKFMPGLTDWAVHHVYDRTHPLGRRRSGQRAAKRRRA